tara:strand:+ start:1179 stop:1982 length:804 start_codon:yes stop_codon:yes gene_type:complete
MLEKKHGMLPLVVPDFLSATEVAYTLLLLTNSVWYPCPMQEAQWPMKRCTKLNVSHLASKMTAWRLSTPYVAVTKDLPSTANRMRHCPHYDVFPERNSTIPPNATKLVYLTDTNVPSKFSGQTIFPRANISVTPRAGTLVSWINTFPNGNRNPYSLHGVDVYGGDRPRIAFQVPIEGLRGTSEHVGCGSGGKGRRDRVENSMRVLRKQRDRWQDIAIRHLWRRVRSHALIVGKFVRAMTMWYEEITTSPPNGQEFQKAAKRFKGMAA